MGLVAFEWHIHTTEAPSREKDQMRVVMRYQGFLCASPPGNVDETFDKSGGRGGICEVYSRN